MGLTAYLVSGRMARSTAHPTPEELRQAVWIDLLQAAPHEAALVSATVRLAIPSGEALCEIEASSRLAAREGVLYLTLPLVSAEDVPRTAAVGFVLSPERLLTVRFHQSPSFEEVAARLGQEGTRSAPEVLVGLLETLVDRQADVLEQARADLDEISRRIFVLGAADSGGRKDEDAALRRVLGSLGRIAEVLSRVRETEMGLSRLVPYVQAHARDWLSAPLAPRLDVLAQDIGSVASFNDFITQKLQFLLDATLGFISIAQNNVMKVLTIASVVGIPPVLVAGIYGMNFKFMPELNWTWGYAYAWGVIIVTSMIPLAVFRWRRWI